MIFKAISQPVKPVPKRDRLISPLPVFVKVKSCQICFLRSFPRKKFICYLT